MFNKLYKKFYRSAVFGAAVGDALGVPWEFNGRSACHCIDMIGYGTHEQKAGTFSDDTSMLLCTCASLKENDGKIDIDDIRSRFIAWMRKGEYAIDGNVFDIGITVSSALSSGRGMTGERDNGNGSLMRILPLAFINASHDEIGAVSAITHAHRISIEACQCYIGIARDLMDGVSVDVAISHHQPTSSEFERLNKLGQLDIDDIKSGGYVVHTLEAALWCLLTTSSYKECVLKAVNLGSDTDTTACVAGGLAGIVYGFDSIPDNWIATLRGKDIIEDCL